MASFKVVIQVEGEPSTNTHSEYDLEMESLAPVGAEITEGDSRSDSDFLKIARDADAIIGTGRISKTVIENLSNCKIIAIGSVGTDTVDMAAATKKGIPVSNCPDTFVAEVADHTMAILLATFRRLTLTDAMARDGRWEKARPFLYQFPRLMGQTLGLISFGHIAREVATRAAPFGLRILAYDPYIEELIISQYGVEPVGLVELLERSDIVSMHAPGTEETYHMLTEEHFRLMKPRALFINNGRGSTVDESALIKALEEKWIAGAGLDVLEKEPPDPQNPILHMDNVILSPHVASASARFDPQRRRRVGQEIALALTGRWPRACVNPSVLGNSDLTRWQPYSMGNGPSR